MCWVLADLFIDGHAKYECKIQMKREYVNRGGKIIKQGKFILIVGVNFFVWILSMIINTAGKKHIAAEIWHFLFVFVFLFLETLGTDNLEIAIMHEAVRS